ncbi:cation transporter [Candidatus Bathyarchaeota archaeon]|jgi:cation diffusion facilitator family transporter|nr:cation transporter [Candidatus Bathyarchaeota archaeon]MBT4319870.1 cation transporter [Candidatus Bathyarchaeota archaeon]MBT4423974.1 cation transporter [Candidatus Bathyarchaeota archaeon]MBT5642012.1 cation transporter [Candidatus Bathyarchaeota archaeon]MBT6605517.1 cation transporter [Candidatus Bathyarchaeota archaeon]
MDKKTSALTAIIGGIFIFALKLFTWYISGSIALLSDALESIVNIVASLMMYWSIRVSEKPPDVSHPYGHQKVENLSCAVEGVLVLFAALLIFRTAYERLTNPVELVSIDIALFLSLLATTGNGFLSWRLMRTAEETGSLALEGDAKHLLSDVISSGAVVIGLFIGQMLEIPVLDPLMALAVSVIVLKMGGEMVYKAGRGLMDESCPETEEKIRVVMDRHQHQFIDYHDLKTRKSGDTVYAELHLSVDGHMSVNEAHDFTDHLEEDLEKEVSNVEITIHVEPKN